MLETKSGEPVALPQGGQSLGGAAQSTMTLLDVFACEAMSASVAAHRGFSMSERAEWAYSQARAMLRARDGGAA